MINWLRLLNFFLLRFEHIETGKRVKLLLLLLVIHLLLLLFIIIVVLESIFYSFWCKEFIIAIAIIHIGIVLLKSIYSLLRSFLNFFFLVLIVILELLDFHFLFYKLIMLGLKHISLRFKHFSCNFCNIIFLNLTNSAIF